MSLFSAAERMSTRWSRALALVGLTGLLLLSLMTVADILLRWIFASPITGVRDAGSLFVAVVITSCFPACIAEQRNITIRFAGKLFGSRCGNGLDTFGNLVTLAFFGLMAWQLWLHAGNLARNNETTLVLGWPVAPWWRAITLLVILCLPVQMIVIWRFMRSSLAGRGTPEELPLPRSQDASGGEL